MTTVLEPPDHRDRPEPPPRRRVGAVGVLWRIFAGLLIAGGLLWGTYNVVTVLAHEERVEIETFAVADVEALDVRSANGSVRIVATDTEVISVRAEISDGLRATGERREVVNGVLELRARCPNFGSDFCWVNYQVEIPRDVPIDVHADNGRIEVSGSGAAVVVDGDNGTVELSELSGPVEATTDNGRVEGSNLTSDVVRTDSDNGRVVLDFAAAPTTVEATSDNGSVEVIVPDDGGAYRVSLETDNGDEALSVRADPDSPRSLTLSTDNGDVTARTAP